MQTKRATMCCPNCRCCRMTLYFRLTLSCRTQSCRRYRLSWLHPQSCRQTPSWRSSLSSYQRLASCLSAWHRPSLRSDQSLPAACCCRRKTQCCCPACPCRRCRCRPMKMSRPGISCPSSSHLLLNPAGPKTFTIHTSLRSGTAAAKTFARCKRTTPPDLVNTVLKPDPSRRFRSAQLQYAPGLPQIGARPTAAKGHRQATWKKYGRDRACEPAPEKLRPCVWNK